MALSATLTVAACSSDAVRTARPGTTPAAASAAVTQSTAVPSAPTATVTPASTAAHSGTHPDPGGTTATERPGPTPIAGEVRAAPEFVDLVTADGSPFLLADLRGHPTLLFFGYTHCPDVCPSTLGELIGVMKARPDVRVAFITVDPERDTPEFLAEWTAYLPDGLVGVTGSPLAIRHAADQYGVRYARVDTESRSGYAMSHTANQYLIDAQGDLLLTYPFGTLAAAIIGDLDALGRAG